MKRKVITTLTLCVALGLVVASMGCEEDKKTEYGWVRVDNMSSYTIGYLYISPTSASDWGPDQLGSFTIDPGESFTVYNVEVGHYDMRMEDLSHNMLAERYGDYIPEAGFVWTLVD